MKDDLLEKLMQLFEDKIAERSDRKSSSTLDHSPKKGPAHWGEITHIENNTYFIRNAESLSKRILCSQERLKLTTKSRRFLSQLCYLDVIGEKTFELIINQLLFSNSDFVTLHETKWVIMDTLKDSLTPHQLSMLNLILYQHEDNVTQH